MSDMREKYESLALSDLKEIAKVRGIRITPLSFSGDSLLVFRRACFSGGTHAAGISGSGPVTRNIHAAEAYTAS